MFDRACVPQRKPGDALERVAGSTGIKD